MEQNNSSKSENRNSNNKPVLEENKETKKNTKENLREYQISNENNLQYINNLNNNINTIDSKDEILSAKQEEPVPVYPNYNNTNIRYIIASNQLPPNNPTYLINNQIVNVLDINNPMVSSRLMNCSNCSCLVFTNPEEECDYTLCISWCFLCIITGFLSSFCYCCEYGCYCCDNTLYRCPRCKKVIRQDLNKCSGDCNCNCNCGRNCSDFCLCCSILAYCCFCFSR